jgi:Nucleotidyl transferase AbiEii toxin, Type IV TA system
MSETQTLSKHVVLADWVAEAKSDPVKFLERQVTEILLHAIGITDSLKNSLVLKGGILMSILHGSSRQTGDVDFTAIVAPQPYAGQLEATLNTALARAAADLGYLDIQCAVQKFQYQPKKDGFADKDAPALALTVGYAKTRTSDATRLAERQSTRVLEIDISFKEQVLSAADLIIEEPDISIQAYSLEEIIAEKIRATLQQTMRNRSRRQDIYDIRWLIELYAPDQDSKDRILNTLLIKSAYRKLHPTAASLDDPAVKERSGREWGTMQLELGARLPDFEQSYEIVRRFYCSLPWKLAS